LRLRATSGTGGAGGSSANQFGVEWLVTDQLGTPRIILDLSGSLANVSRHDYLPFGEELFAGVAGRSTSQGYPSGANAIDGARQKFTLKERDNETELDYFVARYYSSTQGRFTSPDEFSGGPFELFVRTGDSKKQALPYAEIVEPQSLNKYSYVYNNPCRYVDPDGHCGTPSGLKPGQVGICVSSFIQSKLVWAAMVPSPGRGDGRGTNGQGGTSRVEVRVIVDAEGGVTKTNETMGRSGIVIKDLGPKGSGGNEVSSPNKDDKGNVYFQIHQLGTSNTPAGWIGSIENHLNMVATPDQKVGVTPSSTAKDYPSLEVYKYTVDDKGNVTTTLVVFKPESGNVGSLGKDEKPIKADPQ
jgi:RHS repeat-associated protein